MDPQGRQHRLKVIEAVSGKWRKIGLMLGQTLTMLDNYKTKEMNDNTECCQRVFDHWIRNSGHGTRYPLTWEGLHELLMDAEYASEANNLKMALASMKLKLKDC